MGRVSQEWLDGLKAGDEWIFAKKNGGFASIIKVAVLKRTATQIVCRVGGNSEVRYRAKGGVRCGTYFDEIPTPSTEAQIDDVKRFIQRAKLVRSIRDAEWSSIPIDALQAFAEHLKIGEAGND